MAGSTPNRGYPFPQNPDRINVAGDIEALARKIDLDMASVAGSGSGSIAGLQAALNAETTNRANADAALQADYIARDNAVSANVRVAMHAVNGDSGGRRDTFTNIQLQAGWSQIGLDGFAHGVQPFLSPFAEPPIVTLSSAWGDLWLVGTTGGAGSGAPGVTTTEFHLFAANRNGVPLTNGVVVVNWMAMGFAP